MQDAGRLRRPRPSETIRPGPFVGDYLLYLLAAASHAISSDFHALVRRHGMRVSDWRVLACLSDVDGLMITELAALVLYEQSRLTKVVDQLERRGLVERRGDPADRRRVRVFITRSGQAAVMPLVREAEAHESALLRSLPEREARSIKKSLRVLIRHGGIQLAAPPQDGSRQEIV